MLAFWPNWRFSTGRSEVKQTATRLYGRCVTWARAPRLYEVFAVPDTPEGRMEMILVAMALMIRRLMLEGAAGEPLARALVERFVTDMDDCMREMGVSDVKVATKVKKSAAALFDRTQDYGGAFEDGHTQTLQELLAMNVFGNDVEAKSTGDVAAVAAHVKDAWQALIAVDAAAVVEGRFDLLGNAPETDRQA